MKFLLDENFPKSAVGFVVGKGHQTVNIQGPEDEGENHTILVKKVACAGAATLMTDRDFYHTFRHRFPDHSGVVDVAV